MDYGRVSDLVWLGICSAREWLLGAAGGRLAFRTSIKIEASNSLFGTTRDLPDFV